jgi:hypothetical protein
MTEGAARTAVFIVRVWNEEGVDGETLRARIVQTFDAADPAAAETFALSSKSGIVAAIRAFLDRAAR